MEGQGRRCSDGRTGGGDVRMEGKGAEDVVPDKPRGNMDCKLGLQIAASSPLGVIRSSSLLEHQVLLVELQHLLWAPLVDSVQRVLSLVSTLPLQKDLHFTILSLTSINRSHFFLPASRGRLEGVVDEAGWRGGLGRVSLLLLSIGGRIIDCLAALHRWPSSLLLGWSINCWRFGASCILLSETLVATAVLLVVFLQDDVRGATDTDPSAQVTTRDWGIGTSDSPPAPKSDHPCYCSPPT